MLRNFEELKEELQNITDYAVGIVNAVDESSIKSAVEIKEQKLALPVLIGQIDQIKRLLLNENQNPKDFTIYDASNAETAARIAVDLVNDNKLDILLKGQLQTGELFKSVLNKEYGIRKNKILSNVTALEIPEYHKLMFFTDGALMLEPTYEQKKLILENALNVLHGLGYEKPKVGIIEANEVVNENLPSSVEAKQLMDEQVKGQITGCVIDGPISVDLASSPDAVAKKGYESEVAGDADLMLFPNLTSANVLVKAIQTFGRAQTAGVVMGAKVPIVMVSRASSAEEKVMSLVLALVLVNNTKEELI